MKSITILLIVIFCSCAPDAPYKKILLKHGENYPEYTVELFNIEGVVVRSWQSDGPVDSRPAGYYFIEKGTGKTIKVNGTVVVTQVIKK